MADFSKDEWLEWCRHPITEQYYKDFQDKINSETWSLIETAGNSQHEDARASGRILAFGELMNWEPIMQEVEVEEVEDEA